MKVFLLGHKGWIGGKVLKTLIDKNIDVICSNLRAEDPKILNEIIINKVTHVYCCTGRTHGTLNNIKYNTIDYLENDSTFYENLNDNLYNPINLALFCDKNNIHFTYIGTGCIYEYDLEHTIDNNKGFTENDEPNFFGSKYSIAKGFVDKILKNTNALVLRIRMPISSDLNNRNFITKIIKYKKICSIQNSMSVLDELIPLSISMMNNNETGIYNFTNPGTISHNEVLELYRDIIDPSFKWENFNIDEQDKVLKAKRSNNFLDTSKLENKYTVKNIKESTKDAILKMKKYHNDLKI